MLRRPLWLFRPLPADTRWSRIPFAECSNSSGLPGVYPSATEQFNCGLSIPQVEVTGGFHRRKEWPRGEVIIESGAGYRDGGAHCASNS